MKQCQACGAINTDDTKICIICQTHIINDKNLSVSFDTDEFEHDINSTDDMSDIETIRCPICHAEEIVLEGDEIIETYLDGKTFLSTDYFTCESCGFKFGVQNIYERKPKRNIAYVMDDIDATFGFRVHEICLNGEKNFLETVEFSASSVDEAWTTFWNDYAEDYDCEIEVELYNWPEGLNPEITTEYSYEDGPIEVAINTLQCPRCHSKNYEAVNGGFEFTESDAYNKLECQDCHEQWLVWYAYNGITAIDKD